MRTRKKEERPGGDQPGDHYTGRTPLIVSQWIGYTPGRLETYGESLVPALLTGLGVALFLVLVFWGDDLPASSRAAVMLGTCTVASGVTKLGCERTARNERAALLAELGRGRQQ